MTSKKREFIQQYIDELYYNISDYSDFDVNRMYNSITKIIGIFEKEFPDLSEHLHFNNSSAEVDTQILIGLLEKELIEDDDNISQVGDTSKNEIRDSFKNPLIFLSHSSKDKKYADALEKFITGLGVKDNQLIYTSHPCHKIPLNMNIYEYLRKHINSNIFMIILWSDEYLQSPACLNEMGAAWVTQSDYTNIYVPNFDFGNPKYHECAVDNKKMGIVLNGNQNCKAGLLELKKKIIELFNLDNDEQRNTVLIDNFLDDIKRDI